MKQITLTELENWKSQNINFDLVDVREDIEHEHFNIGGQLIPLSDVMRASDEIATDKPVVVYCKRGIRSQIAIQKLEQRFGFKNLYNLQDGIYSLF